MAKPEAVEALQRSLKKARKAARALRSGARGNEPLHDFRVALRRMVILLKEYETLLGVPKPVRRKLLQTLKDTGAARDGQVQRKWLTAAGLDGASARIPKLDAKLGPRFKKAASRLELSLKNVSIGRKKLRKAGLKAARRRRRQLRRKLARLDTPPSGRALHKARIGVKRLRYLLESLHDPPAGMPSLKQLERLQTTLGKIHDRDVLAGELAPHGPAAARLRREREALLRKAGPQWRCLAAQRTASAIGTQIGDKIKASAPTSATG